jgi:hypothetical protein
LLHHPFITGTCIISNHKVHLNNKMIYQSDAADVPAFLLSVYQRFQFNYPKFYKMDNLSKLGWLTAEILLQQHPLTDHYTPEQIGLVLSNASSSLDADLRYSATMNEAASPALFVYTLPNIVIGEISIRHKFKGENAFFISESFDAHLLETQVNLLLDNNVLQSCICGWAELLGKDYKAALFVVEKSAGDTPTPFSAIQLNQVINSAHE